MSKEDDRKDLAVPQQPALPVQPNTIRLGSNQEIDLAGLSPEAQEGLRVKHGEMVLDRENRRERLKEDLAVTATKLGQYGKTAAEAAAENLSVTITNTNDDTLGRTEIRVGNTEADRKGEFSRSQTGFGDNTRIWVILAIIAGVVVVLIAVFSR